MQGLRQPSFLKGQKVIMVKALMFRTYPLPSKSTKPFSHEPTCSTNRR